MHSCLLFLFIKELDKFTDNIVLAIGRRRETIVFFIQCFNDRKMLRVSRIGIAVTEGEGSAVDILMAGDVHVTSILNGLDMLLNPKKLKATLRY